MNYSIFFISIICLLSTYSCKTSKVNSGKSIASDELSIVYKNRNTDIPYRKIDFLNDRYTFNYYEDKAKLEKEILEDFNPVSIDSLQYKFNEGINLSKKESIALSLVALKYDDASNKQKASLYDAINEERYEEAIVIAEKVLEKSPLSIQAIFSLYLAYDNIGKGSAVYINKFNYLCRAFQKMGGTSKERPICMLDKYAIEYYAGYYAIGSNSELEKETKDHLDNPLFIYKNILGKEYFICPLK